ncbi:T9SS type A sorting domain-containing protein [Aequorivita sp. CIP111184]|uniref:T9SS type A sorting domain-containing protein n=1 Tax=Aequorivita sp. CIP111184 TaxID=2211356 RepID=UPI000DBC2F7E|nr:T9SS type A sorting domain-containing protein [Aequorivita sp. CIP111184]SRX54975.1 hypothetical protein AEQU1_01995 [Aequorivita sp. CIP111184]
MKNSTLSLLQKYSIIAFCILPFVKITAQQSNNNLVCLPETAPYTTSFDSGGTLEECWSKITTGTNVDIVAQQIIQIGGGGTDYSIYPASGSHFIRFKNLYDQLNNPPDDMYFISPEIADIDNQKRVKFKLISRVVVPSDYYNKANLHIGTMTDPLDISTFTLIETITPANMNEHIVDGRPNVPWKEHTIYFNGYSENDTYIAIIHGDEYFGSEMYLDDFIYEEIPSCPEPYYPEVTDVRYNEVDIKWETYVNSNPSSWEIEYGPTGFIQGSGIVVTANSSPFTITNLMDDTDFDFYIRANCGGTYSEWSTKQIFKTKCEGFPTPYLANFDSQSEGALESCWTALMPEIGSSYWDEINFIRVVDNAPPAAVTPVSTPNCVYLFNETNHPNGNATSDQIVLVSPRLIGLDNTKKISFWMKSKPNVYANPEQVIIGSLSDSDDATTFTPFYTITDASTNEGTWRFYEIELSNYYLTDEYIGIKQASVNERQLIYFDDFSYEDISCVIPTNLAATQSGNGTVTFSWQDNNPSGTNPTWEIEYGPKGFTQGTGTVVAAPTNPFEISGLDLSERYDYYVRSNCNNLGDFSNWSTPYSFRVVCAFTAPFYEGFDQYDASLNNLPDGIPDFCWTQSNIQVSGVINPEGWYSRPISLPNGGFVNYYGSSQTPDPGFLVSPYFSDFDNNKTIKIWLKNDFDGAPGNRSGIIVGTMSNPLDFDTFTPFTSIDGQSIPIYGKEFMIDFEGYTGNDHHIAILHDQAYDLSLFIFDDVYYKNKPSCIEPVDIRISEITSTTAFVEWDNFSTANSFELEYGLEGFTQGAGTTITINDTSTIIDNLTEETAYEFYIRTDCGSGNLSEWMGPKKFTTSCTPLTATWIENFDNMTVYGPDILPDCFKVVGNWVSSNVPLSSYQQGDGDNEYLFINPIPQLAKTSIITPMLQLTAGTTYNFTFKVLKDDTDYTFQGFTVKTGTGNTHEMMINRLNYFSDFEYGNGSYFPIETIFTPVVSGDYSFAVYFSSSDNTIVSVDSFSVASYYPNPIVVPENNPVLFDFESNNAQLILEETDFSECSRIFDTSNYVLKMGGHQTAQAWMETNDDTENWTHNQSAISKLNYQINATAIAELTMSFDLKQNFVRNANESIFRVVVNGEIVLDNTFATTSGSDQFTNIELDLSAFAGGPINISMQHIGRYGADFGEIGDNAFVDNIILINEEVLGLDNFKKSSLVYFPNPVKNSLYLKSNSNINKTRILNILGQNILSYTIKSPEALLDLSTLQSGIYLIEVEIDGEIEFLKIVKE